LVPGRTSWDAFVAGVEAPHRVMGADTLRLKISYGVAGARGSGLGTRDAVLNAMLGNRRLVSRKVTLPDSGTVSSELAFPASLLPSGWSALQVRLVAAADSEPRDDARIFVIEVAA